ncbi:hypothetical protein ANAPC5_01224 [Anaplasma phagocytophilum]|nr:hypothetical protein ANAPC5_01224 [Anaplasma phagocytophilum]
MLKTLAKLLRWQELIETGDTFLSSALTWQLALQEGRGGLPLHCFFNVLVVISVAQVPMNAANINRDIFFKFTDCSVLQVKNAVLLNVGTNSLRNAVRGLSYPRFFGGK